MTIWTPHNASIAPLAQKARPTLHQVPPHFLNPIAWDDVLHLAPHNLLHTLGVFPLAITPKTRQHACIVCEYGAYRHACLFYDIPSSPTPPHLRHTAYRHPDSVGSWMILGSMDPPLAVLAPCVVKTPSVPLCRWRGPLGSHRGPCPGVCGGWGGVLLTITTIKSTRLHRDTKHIYMSQKPHHGLVGLMSALTHVVLMFSSRTLFDPTTQHQHTHTRPVHPTSQ